MSCRPVKVTGARILPSTLSGVGKNNSLPILTQKNLDVTGSESRNYLISQIIVDAHGKSEPKTGYDVSQVKLDLGNNMRHFYEHKGDP